MTNSFGCLVLVILIAVAKPALALYYAAPVTALVEISFPTTDCYYRYPSIANATVVNSAVFNTIAEQINIPIWRLALTNDWCDRQMAFRVSFRILPYTDSYPVVYANMNSPDVVNAVRNAIVNNSFSAALPGFGKPSLQLNGYVCGGNSRIYYLNVDQCMANMVRDNDLSNGASYPIYSHSSSPDPYKIALIAVLGTLAALSVLFLMIRSVRKCRQNRAAGSAAATINSGPAVIHTAPCDSVGPLAPPPSNQLFYATGGLVANEQQISYVQMA